MTKKALVLACAVVMLGAVAAQAAPIVIVLEGTTTGGNDLYTFNIDPNGTVFDTIDIVMNSPEGGFLGNYIVGAVLFAPGGGDETDVLGLNTVAMGWQILETADSPTDYAAAGGPLGLNITAPLDFAQAALAPGTTGTYVVSFADDGQLVGSVEGTMPVPEPTSLALLCLSGLALAFRRR